MFAGASSSSVAVCCGCCRTVQAISSLMIGYRDYLTVTRVASKSRIASENADKLVITVTDVSLPVLITTSPPLMPATPGDPASSSSSSSCVFRIEFDRAGSPLSPTLCVCVVSRRLFERARVCVGGGVQAS